MTRSQLLCKICPFKGLHGCRDCSCSECNVELNKLLDEYDKHIIEQYKENIKLKDTIKNIHDSVSIQMYFKAIDDFVHKVKEHNYILSDFMNNRDYGMYTIGIEQIAEELKAGVKHEI